MTTITLPKISLMLLILFLASPSVYPQRRQKKEQRSFATETPIARPIKLPKSVIELLLLPEEKGGAGLKGCLDEEPDISEHVSASSIDMNGDGAKDIIVQAESKCAGLHAHGTTWWVFSNVGARFGRRSKSGYDLIFSDAGDFFAVLNTWSYGFRDLSMTQMVAAGLKLYETIYKFDGQKYQPRICTLRNYGKKPVRISCGQ